MGGVIAVYPDGLVVVEADETLDFDAVEKMATNVQKAIQTRSTLVLAKGWRLEHRQGQALPVSLPPPDPTILPREEGRLEAPYVAFVWGVVGGVVGGALGVVLGMAIR